MSEKSWAQIRAELEMFPRQMCITPVAEVKEYIDEILKLHEQHQSAQQEIGRLRRELAEKDAKIERMSASSGMILAKFAEKTADFRTVLEMYASGKYDDDQRARDVLMKWAQQ